MRTSRLVILATLLVALTSGAITGREAIARGAQIEGEAGAIERMRAILPAVRASPHRAPA